MFRFITVLGGIFFNLVMKRGTMLSIVVIRNYRCSTIPYFCMKP